jgi:shikimate kinase
MRGRARAPAAGTILNALATGRGAAFAIDAHTTATVALEADVDVTGQVAGAPDADTRLIERCVERVLERYATEPLGGRVETESEVAMAAGLKSSSAAANATVLATLSALDPADPPSREDACRIGVEAARDVGVTVTGAFDDASASMLGGVTVTDNTADELLDREPLEWDVLVWTPPERAYSADADVDRCRRIAPVAEAVEELAMEGNYATAMTINGFAFSAALSFPTEPMMEALPAATGVSLSGTGPSVVAVGEREALGAVREEWEQRGGTTWQTTTQNDGARTT